jgi:Protein of unknown function (DUF1579)
MARRIPWSGMGLACALALVAGSALRADDKQPDLEAYLKASQPGPEHKKLEPMVGSWEVTVKAWMDPSKPAMESKGTAEQKLILGGRYLQQDVKGEFAGQPFTGLGLTGFDKVQGKYVGTWVDSMGTGFSNSVGTVDNTGKVFTFTREEVDPITKEKSKARDVVRIIDNDKHVMESYKDVGGKEIKMMEITYTRKK